MNSCTPLLTIYPRSTPTYVYITLLCSQRRLDTLAEAGVPVWVTELDVNMDDYSDCAQAYEDLLRTMFSHPVVEGIIMWGFWDEDHLFPFCPHVVGENLTVSAMGKRCMAIRRLSRDNSHDV